MAKSVSTGRHRSQLPVSTHWTQLRLAAQASTQRQDARAAFQEFCRRYWSAIYGVIRLKHSEDSARDLTQRFFLEHLIERDDLRKVDQERGQFRAWLWTALQRFLIDDWRSRTRQKNDERAQVALDIASVTVLSELRASSPEIASASEYELLYARNIAERSLQTLHERWAPKLARRGARIEPSTLLTWLIERDAGAIAAQLGIRVDNARQTISRLHADLWRIFEAEIAQTVTDRAHLHEEMIEVCRILGLEPPHAGQA